MFRVEDLRTETADMTPQALLRHLLVDKFPGRCVVTSALRIRSIVVLDMVARIDRSTPVIFCHASYVYAESIEYRAQIVRRLGLTDARDPGKDEADVLPGDEDHHEAGPRPSWPAVYGRDRDAADKYGPQPGQPDPGDEGLADDDGTGTERLEIARVTALQLTSTGVRISRRTLRDAGLRGSNAELGALARAVGPELARDDPGDQ